MSIKISNIKSSLHDVTRLNESSSKYLKALEEKLGSKLNFTDLDDYDCDLKLIYVETGGSEGYYLKAKESLKAPYYLLTSLGNNSLAASMEILTYLNIHGEKGEIIHGDIDYVAKRIKELETIERVKKQLKNTRFGVIGHPSDWLIGSVPNYDLLKEKMGITLLDIPLSSIEENYNKLNILEEKLQNNDFDQVELDKANKFYHAVNRVIKDNKLDGFTVRCFDLLTSLKTSGCLSLALMNQKGITSTCEGDIMAMISMHLAKLVSGQSSFQANPSRIDVTNNEIVFAHCTIPLDMVESYRYDTHFESNSAVAIKGELYCRDITVLRLSSSLDDYFVSRGTILTNMDDKSLCRTQIKVKMEEDVSLLLRKPCGNHHIIFYGDYKDTLDLILKELLK